MVKRMGIAALLVCAVLAPLAHAVTWELNVEQASQAERFKLVRLDELFSAAQKSRALVEKKSVKPATTEQKKP